MSIRFNIILDSRKSGHVIKPGVHAKDRKTYDYDSPPCFSDEDELSRNPRYPHRPRDLGAFILDTLIKNAKKMDTAFWIEYETERKALILKHSFYQDCDIMKEFMNFTHDKDGGGIWGDELKVAKTFVVEQHKEWGNIRLSSPRKPSASKAKQKEVDRERDAKYRNLSIAFNQGPPRDATRFLRKFGLLERYMAVYAYTLSPRFAFHVAFTTLCRIKAQARGMEPIMDIFGMCLVMSKPAMRIMEAQHAGWESKKSHVAE